MNFPPHTPTPETRRLERVFLEAVDLTSQVELSGTMLRSVHPEMWFKQDIKHHIEAMLCGIRAKCLAQKLGCLTVTATASIEYPDGVWQHLKERWFPRWLLARYPVRTRTKTVTRVETFDVFKAYPDAPELDPRFGMWGVIGISKKQC